MRRARRVERGRERGREGQGGAIKISVNLRDRNGAVEAGGEVGGPGAVQVADRAEGHEEVGEGGPMGGGQRGGEIETVGCADAAGDGETGGGAGGKADGQGGRTRNDVLDDGAEIVGARAVDVAVAAEVALVADAAIPAAEGCV